MWIPTALKHRQIRGVGLDCVFFFFSQSCSQRNCVWAFAFRQCAQLHNERVLAVLNPICTPCHSAFHSKKKQEHGYTIECVWTSGQQPHQTKQGKKMLCKTEKSYLLLSVVKFWHQFVFNIAPRSSPATKRSDDRAKKLARFTQNPKQIKRAMTIEPRETDCETLLEEFTENLEDTEAPAPAHTSQDSDSERPTQVAPRKHSICTHFPKDRNCEVCPCCEDLSWNHRTLTPHRSETNCIAASGMQKRRRYVCCAFATRLGWNMVWWFYGMLLLSAKCSRLLGRWENSSCKAIRRTIQRPSDSFWCNGWTLPLFCTRPVKATKFDKKILLEMFWKRYILVANIEEVENMDASEFHPRRINAKEVFTPQKREYFTFPETDRTTKLSGRDYEFRAPTRSGKNL